MTEYVFRHLEGSQYEVAKFSDDGVATQTYRLVHNEHHTSCTCPSYKQPCKHQQWLLEWLSLPNKEGMIYDDEDGGFYESPLGGSFIEDYLKQNE